MQCGVDLGSEVLEHRRPICVAFDAGHVPQDIEGSLSAGLTTSPGDRTFRPVVGSLAGDLRKALLNRRSVRPVPGCAVRMATNLYHTVVFLHGRVRSRWLDVGVGVGVDG